MERGGSREGGSVTDIRSSARSVMRAWACVDMRVRKGKVLVGSERMVVDEG